MHVKGDRCAYCPASLGLGCGSARAGRRLGSGAPPRVRRTADKRGAKQILVQLSVAPSEEIA